MKYGVRDRRCDADHRQFANALAPNGFTCGSCSSTNITSMPPVCQHGPVMLFREVRIRDAPVSAVDDCILHQRHTDAAYHRAEALAGRQLRIDDPARPIGARRGAARGFRPDPDRRPPLRTPRRTSAWRTACSRRLAPRHRGFHWLADPMQRVNEIVSASHAPAPPRGLPTRRLHRASHARHRQEPTVHGRLRQSRIAEGELHATHLQSEALGGDLRHGRPGSWSHVAGRTRHLGRPVRKEPSVSRSRCVVHRIVGGRHPPANPPLSVPHRFRAWDSGGSSRSVRPRSCNTATSSGSRMAGSCVHPAPARSAARSSTGSIPVAAASSSIAHSRAKLPLTSPGARIGVGVWMFMTARR